MKAFGEVEELTKRIARQEGEVRYRLFNSPFFSLLHRLIQCFQTEKAKLEGQSQLETLQGELASSRQRSLELESQVAETEKQVASLRGQVAEAERQLALLRGEQDATYVEAFQLGMEVRARISREHPEWDLL